MPKVALSVLIAPDSFKGSLSASEAATAIADGWHSVRPDDRLTLIPQADGGEGTLDVIELASAGVVRHNVPAATGPDGRKVDGDWLELPGDRAVVELAQVSGIGLMARLDPLRASTRGLGETIAAALDAGATSLVIGLGGSASTDGGAGALSALGLSLRDESGRLVPDGGAGLAQLVDIQRASFRRPPANGVTLLSDVTNPLLGPRGSAAIFGPQKGASPPEIELLDSALDRFAQLLGGDPSAPGTGAAGGAAFGFASAWGSRIVSGADYIAEVTGLGNAISTSDIVMTGEGSFDEQSLSGKVVGRILDRAEAAGVRAGIVAGQVSAAAASTWSISLADLAGSVEAAIADAARWLHRAGSDAATTIWPSSSSK
jgi:glycerate 2-kinase